MISGPDDRFTKKHDGRWRVPPPTRCILGWPVKEISLSPVKALLLGFPIALFLGALLSDIAYLQSSKRINVLDAHSA